MPSKYRAFKEAADTIESLSAQVAAEHARAERAEQQLAERDALREDAERYLWMRQWAGSDTDPFTYPPTTAEEMDTMIDAARAK